MTPESEFYQFLDQYIPAVSIEEKQLSDAVYALAHQDEITRFMMRRWAEHVLKKEMFSLSNNFMKYHIPPFELRTIKQFLMQKGKVYFAKRSKMKPFRLDADYLKRSFDMEAVWIGIARLREKEDADSKIKKMNEGTELFCQLADGFYVVQLKTPDALDAEGKSMGHCIGNGGYDTVLYEDREKFYSLRDKKGIPHATFTIYDGCIMACRGRNDNNIMPQYIPYVRDFIRQKRLSVENDHEALGYVKLMRKNVICQYDLWENKDRPLPDDCDYVAGSLDCKFTTWKTIPNVPVRGWVLANKNMTEVPADLPSVNYDFRGSQIAALPAEFRAENVILGENFKTYPDDSNIENMDIRATKINRLDVVKCKHIILNKTVEHLAADMHVDSLYLADTNVRELPERLTVNGYLVLNKFIEEFPAGLSFDRIDFPVGVNESTGKEELKKQIKRIHPLLDNKMLSGLFLPEEIAVRKKAFQQKNRVCFNRQKASVERG